MIIGAVEQVTTDYVSGWVFSRASELSGQRVLAFLDGACVGAGEIGLPRPDLAAAGLGNGEYGFLFPISLPSPAEAPRVVVALSDCEAVLLQRDAVVGSRRMARAAADFVCGALPAPSRRAWMEKRGWIAAGEAELIGVLEQFGAAGMLAETPEGAADAARRLFEAVAAGPVQVETLEFPAVSDLAQRLLAAEGPVADAGMFVLAAARRGTVRVVETPAAGPGTEAPDHDMAGSVEHPLDGRNLLALRRWVPFAPGRLPEGTTLRVFFPRCAAAGIG